MKINILLSLLGLTVLTLLLAGCGDDTTIKFKDKETGSEYEIEADEDGNSKVKVETEDGEIVSETGSSAKIPEALPADFPWPKNMIIEVTQSHSDESTETHTVLFNFEEEADEIFEAMKNYATDNGLPINLEQQSEMDGEKYFLLNAGTEENGFQISMEASSGMVIFFAPKK